MLSFSVFPVTIYGLTDGDTSREIGACPNDSSLSGFVREPGVLANGAVFSPDSIGASKASLRNVLNPTFANSIGEDPICRLIGNLKEEKKSGVLAVIYSLVFPGAGELYAGRFDVGKYSVISEVSLWLVFAGFQVYGNWLQDDARSFAVSHAVVRPDGKDDQFYINVGNFLTIDEYNEKKLRDRDLAKIYSDPIYFWRWDSDANRNRFRELRVSSDDVFNNSRFVVAAVVLNHIISAINAVRLVAQYNRGIEAQRPEFDIQVRVLNHYWRPDGIEIRLQKSL